MSFKNLFLTERVFIMNYKLIFKKHILYITTTFFVVLALVSIALYIYNGKTRESDVISELPNTTEDKPLEEAKALTTSVTGNDSDVSDEKTTTNSTINDEYLNKLQNEDIQRAAKQAKAMEIVPVLKWQNDLLTKMKSEDINQTIKNIPNFDDSILAQSSLSDGYSIVDERAQNKYVTRLMRVRKLYAIGQENPQLIIPLLRSLHKDSFAKWPAALKEITEYYNKTGGFQSISEPDAFTRCSDYCLAATYLLAEFGDYESLPLLAQQYKIHDPWTPPDQMCAPVTPATTFYAMHRLVSTYPRSGLSGEAIEALDEYLEAAEKFVPPPTQIKVTIWDSSYSESDPRLDALGLKKEILQGQKSMTIPLYPITFKDGSRMQEGNGIKSKRLDELFNKLDAFVQIAYPQS
jgi:hypothetical protein